MSAYWQFQTTGTVYHERHVSEEAKEYARPVVVIDPEDAVQVVRLVALFCANGDEDLDDPAAMTLALREFASPTPAKPDEPTGLAAVVIDAEGRRYVRCDQKTDTIWHCPDDDTGEHDGKWRHIHAVRVLSEGVQP